jgi:drug/metabolite transporter (DMT)-like permease
VFAHEVPDAWAAAGIAVSCTGLTGVALWGIRGRRPNWAAIGAALATGVSIAAYTVVDGLGVRASGSSLGYIAWLMAVQGVVIPAYAAYRLRSRLIPALRPFAALGLLGSVLSVAAYALVLWAQTRAELAPISALRESSIIVGAAIGAVFFKERFGAPRIAAAGLLVVGIGLMLHAG